MIITTLMIMIMMRMKADKILFNHRSSLPLSGKIFKNYENEKQSKWPEIIN